MAPSLETLASPTIPTLGSVNGAVNAPVNSMEDVHTVQSEDRVEPAPQAGFPHHLYPMWIGHKFMPDGQLLPFPGHTIICHISPESELFRALRELYEALKSQEFASLYILLPPSSWHMTIFEGVSDQIRKSCSWPASLALDEPLSSCTTFVRERLAVFNLECEPPFHMVVEGYEPLMEGIALKVIPASAEEEKRLRRLRNRLSKQCQMQHPGHDTYSFHISLAYLLRHPDHAQHHKLSEFLQAYRSKLPLRFELGAPEFCTFDNMFAFHHQFDLGNQVEKAVQKQE